jgi:hypothetical protein
MYLKFKVAVCLGGGDGGDVIVSEYVTEKQLERLKICKENDSDFGSYPGLKRLYSSICRSAIEEAQSYDYENAALYANASCIVSFPDGI